MYIKLSNYHPKRNIMHRLFYEIIIVRIINVIDILYYVQS